MVRERAPRPGGGHPGAGGRQGPQPEVAAGLPRRARPRRRGGRAGLRSAARAVLTITAPVTTGKSLIARVQKWAARRGSGSL
ncbi:protein of unknown function [Microbacterium sp. Nx66]|nr:protein of unknown function [Microbacterium sp. Nx66]